jgi:hypothetical protein
MIRVLPTELKTHIDRMIFELRLHDVHREFYQQIHRNSPHNGKCPWYCSFRTAPWPRRTSARKFCDCPQSHPLRPSYIREPYHRRHNFTITYPEIVHDMTKRIRDNRIMLRCVRCLSLRSAPQ